jgi:glucose/arabinose dehydrogenase
MVMAPATLAGSAPAAKTPLTVQVTAHDFSFQLSRRSVPIGTTVRFIVRNRGKTIHDFVVNGHRTRRLLPGRAQAISVRFPYKGTFTFLCSMSGHALLGMKGKFAVGTRAPSQPAGPPPVTVSGSAVLTHVATTERPVFVTSPPGDASRIFVVDQTGTIRVVRDGELLAQPFLDLRDKVRFSSEPGLLSLAFAPDYAQSGVFYVVYNSNQGNGDLHLSEFRRHPTDPDLADPYSERVVLTIQKPWENHNGGMLQFGPDGDLYLSVGDGDSGTLYPPGFFAQRRDDLLGDILRIDTRGGTPYAVPENNPFVGLEGVRPEIWAYGLRNPWRFWIDPPTGDMYIGDAGEGDREEIDLVPKGQSGLNFGWPCFEGSLPFDPTVTCLDPVVPLVDIPHAPDVCAVVGGVVSRDTRLTALEGRYLYGDFCSGRITVVSVADGKVVASDDLGLVVPELSSFGVDGVGRIYVMSLKGDVYRLDPKPAG